MASQQHGFQPAPAGSWPQAPLKKRLILCCDGTWQSVARGTREIPSNAAKMSRCLSTSYTDEKGNVCPQVVYYDSGVGTGMGLVQSKLQGLTGEGLDENVCEAYNFLATNYNPGDEIFFFGFSRGAYTVRAAAGLICNVGICRPTGMSQFWEMYAMYKAFPRTDLRTTPWAKRLDVGKEPSTFTIKVQGKDMDFKTESGWSWMANSRRDVDVKVVGVWDTVGSLGIPKIAWLPFWQRDTSEYGFHDTSIHPEIKNAFQALGLDEHRTPFNPAIWVLPDHSTTNLVQCWFPGSHVNIGGGSDDGIRKRKGDLECMANTTFVWMVDRCQPFLAFDFGPIGQIMTDYLRALDEIVARSTPDSRSGGWGTGGPLHDSYTGLVNTAFGSTIRSPGEYAAVQRTGECMHPVVWHARQKTGYDPLALKGFHRFAAADGHGPYWEKTYLPQEPDGWAAYIPGLAAAKKKDHRPAVTVRVPEFVIPTTIREAQDRLGFPAERALIVNVSHRVPLGLSEEERRTMARPGDREGIEFLEALDRENEGLLR